MSCRLRYDPVLLPLDTKREREKPKRELWYHAEDERLCKSWVHVSNNGIVENDESVKGFWGHVHKDYHTELPLGWLSSRSSENLRNHFGDLGARVKKFQAKHQAELSDNQSGKSKADMLKDAEIAYFEDERKEFKDYLAYEVLKDQPKWYSKSSKKSTKKQKNEMGESRLPDFDFDIDLEDEQVFLSDELENENGREDAKTASQSNGSTSNPEMESLTKSKADKDAMNDISLSKLPIMAEIEQMKARAKLLKAEAKVMAMHAYDPNNTIEQTNWILKKQKEISDQA